ncbi:CdaR family protein [Paludibacter jiangxiensis]|uniref:YbbR-like protein n=1 Tax=Paludibacter jiangxiensis TaxID=681398 RepID=A0A161L8A2_9BACT|nr:YbbR-like domain-containing protein [Paludibacter jiangxiensis]GAT63294.1 YbbR-like protein [Paludibacter jiangxiensis]
MSAKKSIRQIKRLGKKAKAPFPTKEAFVFLSFLIFSTLLWFLYKVSHVQELKVKVPIEYVGIPNNVELVGKLPKTLNVQFKDKGSALFTYILKQELPPFKVDLTGQFKGTGRISLPTNKYEGQIFYKLKPTATQIHIAPDSLIINYYSLYKKVVPVRFYGYIQPAQQFIITHGISVSPAFLEVYGNKQNLDTLKAIYTEPIHLKDVKDSVNSEFYLKVPRGIHLSQPRVKVHAAVEPFTEKTLEVPVTSINLPDQYLLRTFPATVKVICVVGISHFKTLTSESIQAVVNYNTLSRINAGKARIQVFSTSSDLIRYHVSPETVDFLLEIKK